MLLIFFVIAVIIGAIFLFLGYSQYSFPMMYLGMFVFLVLGLFLFSEGLQLDNGAILIESPAGSGNYTTTTLLVTHTTQNNFVVNILANVFFYIPFVGVLLSVFFALRGWAE